MKVIKLYIKGKPQLLEFIKEASVQFDPRPGWILVQEMDKPRHKKELFWIHPTETPVEWIRDFSRLGA